MTQPFQWSLEINTPFSDKSFPIGCPIGRTRKERPSERISILCLRLLTEQTTFPNDDQSICKDGAARGARITLKRGFSSDAEALRVQLAALTAPTVLTSLHQEASAYLDRFTTWLALEVTYLETLNANTLDQANGAIPELNAREFEVRRGISSVKFVYNLNE